MKKVSLLAVLASALVASGSASADWFGDRWGGGNGYNDWPTWTPMYWMEEMTDSMDSNGFGGRNNNYAPYGYGAPVAPYGYGAPAPYGYGAPVAPYGYGAPAPYGYAPAPVAPVAK